MKKIAVFLSLIISMGVFGQTPPSYTSSDILLQLKKLKVFGSVLYVAAHPDDENTRLLAYLAKGKLYKTGYLSLTRGDGGQNLIGNEIGTELGLIRTQELLAARKIDGAQQFFSRAFDFGFCKSTDEALEKWGHEEILSDVVWVIRKFQPDIIITRFPPDSRAGHGHHSASAVLAHEAYKAAADVNKFPEQFRYGVKPWQAKRILWNTFNFGSANTQSEDQFKINVGDYNALLGKGFGELAAESRSQHKSQGFGVAAQRGEAMEYFLTTDGTSPEGQLLSGINTTVQRTELTPDLIQQVDKTIDDLIAGFNHERPEASVKLLIQLQNILTPHSDVPWIKEKLEEVSKLIEICSGLFFEATTNVPYVAAGDSLQVNVSIINRGGVSIGAVNSNYSSRIAALTENVLYNQSKKIFVPVNTPFTQPYWLEKGFNKSRFVVDDQLKIGLPEAEPPFEMILHAEIEGKFFTFKKPIFYKYTDPVEGEIYQPLTITPALSLVEVPKLVFTRHNNYKPSPIKINVTSLTNLKNATITLNQYEYQDSKLVSNKLMTDAKVSLQKNQVKSYTINTPDVLKNTKEKGLYFFADLETAYKEKYQSFTIRKISYHHIPAITYFYLNKVQVIDDQITTVGKKIGYIPGAGDYVPEALQLLNYDVVQLTENDILAGNLKQYDAIITGIRAYNIHEWLNTAYDSLMSYVYNGGNLVVQYNTSSSLGPLKGKIGPYDFDISRQRVTDEDAVVSFLLPQHEMLNWPNKITSTDFKDWLQERGLYFAENYNAKYQALVAANDPGEATTTGSLITTVYGKGRFTYTGLSFFRQLPAGKAYRLFANVIANPKYKKGNGTK